MRLLPHPPYGQLPSLVAATQYPGANSSKHPSSAALTTKQAKANTWPKENFTPISFRSSFSNSIVQRKTPFSPANARLTQLLLKTTIKNRSIGSRPKTKAKAAFMQQDEAVRPWKGMIKITKDKTGSANIQKEATRAMERVRVESPSISQHHFSRAVMRYECWKRT